MAVPNMIRSSIGEAAAAPARRETGGFTIGVNAIGTRHSGAAVVLQAFIEGLLRVEPPHTVVAFLTAEKERQFELPDCSRLILVDAPHYTNHVLARYAWLRSKFAGLVNAARCDVVVNFNNIAGTVDVPQVLFIQQSRYFSRQGLSAYFHDGWSLRAVVEPIVMRAIMRRSVADSQRVIVQTKLMKTLVEKWLMTSRPIDVIPPVPPTLPSTGHLESSGSVSRRTGAATFLYVGNDSPYKNLRVLRQAAQIAADSGRSWAFRLTAGACDGDRAVQAIGRIGREAIAAEYLGANALIMPSLTETVGLPLLEAMQFGTPIVAADLPYAREICGEAALYFDPGSPRDLIRALDEITCPDIAARLSRAGTDRIATFPTAVEQAESWLRVLGAAAAGSSPTSVTEAP